MRTAAAAVLFIIITGLCFSADQNDSDLSQFERINPVYLETDVNNLIQIRSSEDVMSRRAALIRYIWGPESFPASQLPKKIEKNITDKRYADLYNLNLERIDKLVISMEHGFESVVYHFIPKRANGDLFLYHQGHRGDFVLGIDTIKALLEKEYAVMGFAMPLRGMNEPVTVHLERFGRFSIESHAHMRLLDRPIKYFVEPIAVALNYAQNYDYGDIYMTGISGGGWTTTVYAAVDSRIKRSYPVAGSVPIYLRSNDKRDWGDYEQTEPGLYRTANYLELYVMGSAGKGRSQIQILNQYDACCFAGIKYHTYEDTVRKRAERLEGSFKVFLDSSHQEHKISDLSMEMVFKDISNHKSR